MSTIYIQCQLYVHINYIYICVCTYIYIHTYGHPGVDSICHNTETEHIYKQLSLIT